MKSNAKRAEKLSADKLFEQLHKRLNQLLFYSEKVTRLDIEPPYEYSIENIIKRARNCDVTELNRNISSAIEKIEKIKGKGIKILSSVSVEQEYPNIGDYFPADEQEENYVKAELYNQIQTEINYYGNELSNLRDSILGRGLKDTEITPKLISKLSTKTDLPKVPNGKSVQLDIRQSALLFHYLVEANIFLPYDASPLAKLAHHCTGHSRENIRRRDGFAVLEDIKKDIVVDKTRFTGKSFNLRQTKNALLSLIKLIDKDIDNYSKFK